MKILHWAFILIAIILPFSIVCRNTVSSRYVALRDEVRINNAIDTATKDAIDQIIAVSGFDYDDEFGDVIDITPELAQESINTFFHTMAVNYGIPFKTSDETPLYGDAANSYIKNYFATYIPAVVVIAYDGFYVYSQDVDSNGGYYGYKLSSKIPYTKTYGTGDNAYTVGYTLGNDIYLYIDGECYSGRMNYNKLSEVMSAYTTFTSSYGVSSTKEIAALTNDMSVILYSLKTKDRLSIGPELLPTDDVNNFMQDYKRDENSNYTVGAFHENRRKAIIQIVSDCLTEQMNEHNIYADLAGCTYEFSLPEITEDDWTNSINDISVMAFVQGIPVGTTKGTYFNSYALGGSQIVKRDYLYGATYNGSNLYHSKNCQFFTDGYNGTKLNQNDCFIFIDEDDAIANDYHSCMLCN